MSKNFIPFQARNQKFFRAAQVFRNQGTSIKNFVKNTRKKAPQGKFWSLFSQMLLKLHFGWNIQHKNRHCLGLFFPKSKALFSIFKKGLERPPPSTSPSLQLRASIFENCANPLCTRSLEIESALYFFIHCIHYRNICTTFLNELKTLDGNILNLSDTTLTNLMLYGGS